MAEHTERKGRPQEMSPVEWVRGTTPNELVTRDFSRPTIFNDRTLVAAVEGGEIGVGVFALPPVDTSSSKFWEGLMRSLGRRGEEAPKPQPTRLRIEAKIPSDEAIRGEHAPISILHPHVVMEDGTRYGIGVMIPKGMIGQWSEPRERMAEGSYLRGEREIYKQKKSVAVLIRVDGEHPLAEQEVSLHGRKTARHEMLLGIPDPQPDSPDDIFVSISSRTVNRRDLSGKIPNVGDTTGIKAEVSDLVFHTVAQAGTDENTILDKKGLVQVVVAGIIEDEVIELIHEPVVVPYSPREDMWGGQLKSMGVPARGSTVRGETEFSNTRKEQVSVSTVKDVKPLAVFNLALVGHGGPVTAEMTEAPISA